MLYVEQGGPKYERSSIAFKTAADSAVVEEVFNHSCLAQFLQPLTVGIWGLLEAITDPCVKLNKINIACSGASSFNAGEFLLERL